MRLYFTNLVISVFIFLQITVSGQSSSIDSIYTGVDLSFYNYLHDNGAVYYQNGNEVDVYQLFKDNGVNTVRLRIWNNPEGEYYNLADVKNAAQQIKSHGMKLFLDFHYSDTWADPANQHIPQAWQDLSFIELNDSVYSYTYYVIDELVKQGTPPELVQTGNEILCGMLWPLANVCNDLNTNEQWERLTTLLKTAKTAVDDASPDSLTIKTVIHIADGGNWGNTNYFYDKMESFNVSYDYIGLSYYPWWSGTFNDLENNLTNLKNKFNKDVLIVETAYPWTFSWNDNTQNVVGEGSDILSEYPANAKGQGEYLKRIFSMPLDERFSNLKGVMYWAPEYISVPNAGGSSWENLTLFDFSSNALSSLQYLKPQVTDIEEEIIPFKYKLNVFPNPFNPSVTVSVDVKNNSDATIVMYNVNGEEVYRSYSNLVKGNNNIVVNASGLPSGVYFLSLTTKEFTGSTKIVLMK